MSILAWSRFQDLVRLHPDKPAILQGDASCDFAGLDQQARDWARTMPAHPGERVIICAENAIATAAAVLGVWRCGAVPVWVNNAAPLDHVRLAQEQTQAVCVIAPDPKIAATLPGPVFAAPAPTGDNPPLPSAQASDIGSIVYTSGSTGRPKGVVQRAETLIDGASRVAQTLGYREDDRILCPVPFAFDYGWGQLLSLLFGGVTLVLPTPGNAFGLCAAITQHRPTILAGVPAAFANLLSGLSPIKDIDCTSIRLITNTGSRIPDTVLQSLWDTFPDAALSLNYGLTETYRTASLPVALARDKPQAVGPAFPGVEIAIVAPDGRLCPPNETGEIVHCGAGLFEGYWNDPDRTAAVRRPDPTDPTSGRMAVYTGDLGYLDDVGHLVIVGRQDRQMKSMGVRVSPDEIEAILLQTGTMAEVAITSRPDPMVGDLIVGFVVAHPDADPQAALKALKRDSRPHLSQYMTPRVYHLVDTLPRNPNGKVDYVALKQQAAQDR